MSFKKTAEKLKIFFKDCVPAWAAVLYIMAIVSLCLLVIMEFSVGFSDFFNDNIAAYYRAVTAWISGIVFFSIAELVIYMLIPIFVFFFIAVIRATKKEEDRKMVRLFVSAFAIVSFFATSFVFSHAAGTAAQLWISVLKLKNPRCQVRSFAKRRNT